MNTSSRSARGRSTAVKSQIDENLKRVYEHALNEEVPDRFKLLLDQLKQGAAAPVAAGETVAEARSPEARSPEDWAGSELTAEDRGTADRAASEITE